MARALKEIVRCPLCGSSDVIYSCEPKCCFNHVCGACRATFQLVTRDAGRSADRPGIEAEEPASTEPAAACAVCRGLRLAVVESAPAKLLLACADCGRLLELAYEDVAA